MLFDDYDFMVWLVGNFFFVGEYIIGMYFVMVYGVYLLGFCVVFEVLEIMFGFIEVFIFFVLFKDFLLVSKCKVFV